MTKFNQERLLAMLTLSRRHGTEGEMQFIKRYIEPLNPQVMRNKEAVPMTYVVEVGNPNGYVPDILFSAHTDTVHPFDAPVVQEVIYDAECGIAYKPKGDTTPLGADNAAGCAVLLHMIENNVPGVYVFHRGEEVGGIGSSFMAREHAEWLRRFMWAIAFDRRGTSSVITEMMVGRTASDEFAEKLSSLLGMQYAPDNTGTFTDTANYAHIIPECTNVSVGYDNEHSGYETLDMWHVEELAAQLVKVFGMGDAPLPVERDPKKSVSAFEWFDSEVTFGFGSTCSASQVLSMGYKQVVDFIKESDARDVADLVFELAERVAELEEAEQEQNYDRERYMKLNDPFDLYN